MRRAVLFKNINFHAATYFLLKRNSLKKPNDSMGIEQYLGKRVILKSN